MPRVQTPATSSSTIRSQEWHHPMAEGPGTQLQQQQQQQQQQHVGFDLSPTSCHVVVGGTLGRRQPSIGIVPGSGSHLGPGVVPGPSSSSSSLYLTMSHHPGRFHDYATLGNPRLSPGPGGSRGSSVSGPSSVVSAPPPVVTYPMYHTCERQKKRVTIMEDNNTESSV